MTTDLRALRRAAGRSLDDLAEFLRITLAQASNLEHGRDLDWRPDLNQHALLHPFGRCTCAQEGTCEWCRLPCTTCGKTTWECGCEHGPTRAQDLDRG